MYVHVIFAILSHMGKRERKMLACFLKRSRDVSLMLQDLRVFLFCFFVFCVLFLFLFCFCFFLNPSSCKKDYAHMKVL